MQTIAVLGGFGYIGCHVVYNLLSKGYKVIVLDLGWFGLDHAQQFINNPDCKFIQGDICSVKDLVKTLSKADKVIHLAGVVGDPACALDRDFTWAVNIESSRLVADVCNFYNIKRFVFASSCSVYGASKHKIKLNEGSYLNPVSLYAKTKIESERIFFKELKTQPIILRLGTVFGWSKRMRFDLVINLFLMQALKEKRITVFGGEQSRPFLYVETAAKVFELMIETSSRFIEGEIFNVHNINMTLSYAAANIQRLIPETKIEVSEKSTDERDYMVSSEKIYNLLKAPIESNINHQLRETIEHVDALGYEDWKTNPIYSNILTMKSEKG